MLRATERQARRLVTLLNTSMLKMHCLGFISRYKLSRETATDNIYVMVTMAVECVADENSAKINELRVLKMR